MREIILNLTPYAQIEDRSNVISLMRQKHTGASNIPPIDSYITTYFLRSRSYTLNGRQTMASRRHQIAATFLQSYRQKYETGQNL
jgi:hypothetical protein